MILNKKDMKKFEVTVNDTKSIRKMQRMVLILERMAGMLDEYKHIQIEITVNQTKKRWYQIWK